jgi:hypothetical protein
MNPVIAGANPGMVSGAATYCALDDRSTCEALI